jgi:hypothetical protein
MGSILEFAVGVLVVFGLLALAYHIIGGLFAQYTLTEDHIKIASLFVPLVLVRYEDIIEIRRGTLKSLFDPIALHVPSRLSTGVVIQRRKGFLRRVRITPNQPDSFIAEVKEHIDAAPKHGFAA